MVKRVRSLPGVIRPPHVQNAIERKRASTDAITRRPTGVGAIADHINTEHLVVVQQQAQLCTAKIDRASL